MGRAKKPKMVDLYSGIGLGAYGFVRAGFQVAAAADIDSEACKTYEKNLGVKPFEGDLKKIRGDEILKSAGLKKGEVSLCVGCPPCQGFSSLRRTKRKRGQRDNRKSLLRAFAKRVEEISPKAVVLENVSGLAQPGNKRFLREFIATMEDLGYECNWDILDAADYGVPQHRKRLILIGIKGVAPILPPKTHANPNALNGKLPWTTVKDAIADLPPPEHGQSKRGDPLHSAPKHNPSVIKMIGNIPLDGGSRKDLPKRFWLPCHKRLGKHGAANVYGRLSWNLPSDTVTTRAHAASCGRFVHPEQTRALTLREVARLQSVPDDYEIAGFKEQVGKWIGNGMPTVLAEAVGRQVLAQI